MTVGSGRLYQDVVETPNYSDWAGLLTQNLAHAVTLSTDWEMAEVAEVKDQVRSAARRYTSQLAEIAEDVGLSLAIPNQNDPATPNSDSIVMTGHQPLIWHSGLIYKFIQTERLAFETNSTGVSILMDTDSGDAGAFLYPVAPTSADWPASGIASASISSAPGPYFQQRVCSLDELSAMANNVGRHLTACDCTRSLEVFQRAIRRYERLSDRPVVAANAIVRRLAGVAHRLLELPFSLFCQVPGVQAFLTRIAHDGVSLHHRYNQALADYRRARRIRNSANPFPNLRASDSRHELPFWRVHRQTGARQEVWDDNASIDSEWIAVPRGALITTVFRLLASDLFVHGLGGRTYDPFTDYWMEQQFHVAPPHYVVASASRYLFSQSRQRLNRLDDLQSQHRQFSHHPEKHLGRSLFSDDAERRLLEIVKRKDHLVQRLKNKKSRGESAADEGRQLQGLQAEIKKIVTKDFTARLAPLDSMTTDQRDAVESREYPWFFFSWPD